MKEQKLKEAYDKAFDNGWDMKAYVTACEYLKTKGLASDVHIIFIINKDFLKAYFGEEERGTSNWNDSTCRYDYQHYAHRMLDVILRGECPIDYLHKFI